MGHLVQKVARRFLTAEAGREVFLDRHVPKALETWAERKAIKIEIPGAESDVKFQTDGLRSGAKNHPSVKIDFILKDGRSIIWNATVLVRMDANEEDWVGISKWSYDDMGGKSRVIEKELTGDWSVKELIRNLDGLI